MKVIKLNGKIYRVPDLTDDKNGTLLTISYDYDPDSNKLATLYYHPGIGSSKNIITHAANAAMSAAQALRSKGIAALPDLFNFQNNSQKFIDAFMDIGHDKEGYYSHDGKQHKLVIPGKLRADDLDDDGEETYTMCVTVQR